MRETSLFFQFWNYRFAIPANASAKTLLWKDKNIRNYYTGPGLQVAIGVGINSEAQRDTTEAWQGSDSGGAGIEGGDKAHKAATNNSPLVNGVSNDIEVEAVHGVAAGRPRERVWRTVRDEGGTCREELRHGGAFWCTTRYHEGT